MKKINNQEYVKRGELAKLSGFRASTIKFYASSRLLVFWQEGGGLAKYYPKKISLARLEAIKRLREKRMSITDIIDKYQVAKHPPNLFLLKKQK